jgi:hypothetical protein
MWTITICAGTAQTPADAAQPERRAKSVVLKLDPVTEKSSVQVAVSPSVTLISGTKKQELYTGSALLSNVKSAFYCDVRTHQIGLVGAVSDSRTKSETTQATVLVSDEASVDFLHGMFGKEQYDDDKNRTYNKDAILTQNFFSASADYFLNNSLGIGLQQEYTVGYQRYLESCKPRIDPHRFFSSVGIASGYADQRLYATVSHVNSIITPLSGQLSYVWLSGKYGPIQDGKREWHGDGKPPKAIFAVQMAYTPFPSDAHAYQFYENASLQLPTQWHHLTISLTQMDLYVNNAPKSFRRNYQSGGVQFTFSYATPASADGTNPAGACYTADKASHPYCYDALDQNACVPPSLFRARAHCSASGGFAIQ